MIERPQDRPPTPRSMEPDDLGFERRPMVRWYNPTQLTRTGLKTLLSALFGAYADRRELLAFQPETVHDYSGDEELWIDYVADLGDGFDSSYTVASLLARPWLELGGETSTGGKALPRGRILIMGGDQVYPTATREQYRNRLTGPYRAALPWVPVAEAPHLFAVPGNHDWYDGLTSFQRLFCQRRWIGGWQTRQRRSYFALELPHRWWLWGVDVQLEADIDQPQLDYFAAAAEKIRDGDRMILCTAEPSWIYDEETERHAFSNLAYLERTLLRGSGCRLSLTLAGDLHHYTRYQATDRDEHKVTCGGGGAFFHETHTLPERLESTRHDAGGTAEEVTFERRGAFPSPVTSRWLMVRNLLFPLRNWDFAIFLGLFYMFSAWVLRSSASEGAGELRGWMEDTFPGLSNLLAGELLEGFSLLATLAAHSPGVTFLAVALLGGLVAYVEPDKGTSTVAQWAQRLALGLGHGLVHLGAILFFLWTATHLNHNFVPALRGAEVWEAAVFVIELGFFGGAFGGVIFGVYLIVANLLLGCHNNAGSSALRIADYKSFLRLHLGADGSLTVHPIGVRRVERRWRLDPEATEGASWIVPEEGTIEARARLIEEPIRIS